MSSPVFVGREAELHRLKTFLDKAALAATQVVFISGEAGAGKSSLVSEFIRRAQETDPDLIAVVGECNAQTGIADPYLPFRQVLTTLTVENEEGRVSNDADSQKKLRRWKEFVQVSTRTLMMLGPDLVGIFVPGSQFFTRIGTTIALNSNLSSRLSDMLGKKSDKSAPKIDPTLDQEQIFEQYTAVLQVLAKDNTLILVLDDLQWADSGSLSLLFHLARQLKNSRLLLVGTYRPDDLAIGRLGERHPLEPILNELQRYNGDIVIDLSHSDANQGRQFVDALVDAELNHLAPAFRDELYARTGGHPLFTVELLQDLQERGNLVKDPDGYWIQVDRLNWDTLPPRLEGVIGERISRLPSDLHETLSIASVIGEEFDAQVVGRIQNVQERLLLTNLSHQLEKRYLLVIEQGESKVGKRYLSHYRFAHVMIQHYLYDQLGISEKRLLHHDVAETLEDFYVDQTDSIALQLAHHYEAGGDTEKAIAYLRVAGDNAFRIYAYNEAINAYTRLLELGDQAIIDKPQLYHAYLRRGRAFELINQYQSALQNYKEMLAFAEHSQDQAMELAAKVAASTLYAMPTPVADANMAQKLSVETLKLAQDLGDRVSEARVLWNLQLLNLLQNKAKAAIDYGEQSLAIARELDLPEQMAYVLSDLGWAYNMDCQFDKGDERMEEGAHLWRELGNMPMLINNLNLSLFQLFWSGKNENVLKVADEAYQLSSSIKEIWNQASARNFQGLVWFDYGEVDRSLSALLESVDLAARGNPVYEIWYRAMLCQAYGELGAVDIGMSIYRQHRVANHDLPYAPSRTPTLISYALFELSANQLDTAAATLADCSPSSPPWESMYRIAQARLALARADCAAALEFAEMAIEISRSCKLGRYLPEALFLKGKSLLLCGDLPNARLNLDQARVEASNLGSRRLLWQIISTLATIEPGKEQSAGLKAQAHEIVGYISDHIASLPLRESYISYAAINGEQQ